MAKKTKQQVAERDASIAVLLAPAPNGYQIEPGQTIYTILRHVSRSGMQREISVVVPDHDGGIGTADFHVARAIGARVGKHSGVVMGGCGMDMGFQLVYLLGSRLWPDGTSVAHGKRNGVLDHSGGYALKHRWL